MSNLLHIIKAGGFVMYPLLLLSVLGIAVIIERGMAFRDLGDAAPGLLKEVLRLARERRFDEALRLCEGRRGPVAACLAVILRARHRPVAEIERLVEETGQDYFNRLERFLPFLDTTTTVSPLLGLLGTIIGMVGTFNAIAGQANRSNTDAVLSGVGEALYATATGLVVAIVSFLAYNFFTARLRTVTAETEQAATKLFNVLAEVGEAPVARANHREAIRTEEGERRAVQAS